ncbi:conserved protein, unknown function, partial [Hepatocystis sp. ex Piliocolobus tephrosceles]
ASKETTTRDAIQKCGIFFNFILFVGFLSAVVQTFSTIMTQWRQSNPITYVYIDNSLVYTLDVGYTYYGLYKVVYDGSRIETWTQRVQNMKKKGTEAIQMGINQENSGPFSLVTSVCQAPCRDAIVKRIEAYERVSYISLILLCSILISCTIVLLCIGWNILFTQSILGTMGCFILSFVINCGVGTYWYYETDLAWFLVTSVQQYPFPCISYCFFMYVITTSIWLFCFIFLLMLDIYNKNYQKRERINKVNAKNRYCLNMHGYYPSMYDMPQPHGSLPPISPTYSNFLPMGKAFNNDFSKISQYDKMNGNWNMNGELYNNSRRNMSLNVPYNMSSFNASNPYQNMGFGPMNSQMGFGFRQNMNKQHSYSALTPYQQNMPGYGNYRSSSMHHMPSAFMQPPFGNKRNSNMYNLMMPQSYYKF